MNESGYALVGLTGIIAMLVAVLTFSVLRFAAAAKDAKGHLRDHRSEATFLSAALQDAVGTLKAQEQAMSARAVASEELSSQIVESLTAGLLVVDSAGRVEILNAAGRKLLGVSEPMVGAGYATALQAVPPLVEIIGSCLATARPIVRRTVQFPSAGGPTHFGVTVSPLAGPSAQNGVICLFSDLTAVVELEDQLRLKDTLARLGELTAGIAHEFRNGLATIHGYSRLIDPQSLPAQYRPYVEGIRQETEALGKVVTNFLNFARPEQVSFSLVDVGHIVRRVVDDLRHELPPAATVTVTGEFAPIQGDEVLLRQAFGNLVRNAVEAGQSGRVVPAVVVEGAIDDEQRVCRVCVDDNGTGVPPDMRERVFEPFFTLRAGGTGLGLAIVLKVVVLHNGRISIGNAALGGASMQIAFPMAASDQ